MYKSGIYELRSQIKPHMVYVGSSINVFKRYSRHMYELRRGTHSNQHLLRHAKKYGVKDLKFQLLEFCSIDILIEHEQNYINFMQPKFNMLPAAGSRLGFKASKNTIEKLKIAWKFRKPVSMFSRLFKAR